MWSRLMRSLKHRKVNQQLTAEMCAEIDRLALDRRWFQWVVDEEGLEFGRFALAQRTKESQLFDKWHPRLIDFVASKRQQTPFPDPAEIGVLDTATKRILEPKIRDAERVPCHGNFVAAFFTAPIHLLSFVAADWPSTYRHPVFITPDELTEWRTIYDAEEADQDSWWYVFQDWDAQLNPTADSFWLRDMAMQHNTDVTPALIVWGLCWGSLAGGHHAELWGIDQAGNESFLQDVGDVTY